MLKQVIRVEVDPDDFEDQYDNMLDECYGDVRIAGYDFQTSYALKELDPTAYRCGLLDYMDSSGEDIKYECPICGEQFDDEDEALYCCQDEEEDEEESEDEDDE